MKDGVVGQCHPQLLVFFLLDSISSQTVLTNTSIRLVEEKQHLNTGCKYPFCTNIRHQSRYGVDVLMELKQFTYCRSLFRIKSDGK